MATTAKKAATTTSDTEQRDQLTGAVRDAYKAFYVSQRQPVPAAHIGFFKFIAEALYEAGYRK